MRIKEILNDVNDARQFGVGEALYQRHLRNIYPEVELQVELLEGKSIRSGLLISFDEEKYVVRLKSDFGYITDCESTGDKKFRVVTKDGREMTPELFKELVETRAGKGSLEEIKAKTDAFARSLGISDTLRGR